MFSHVIFVMFRKRETCVEEAIPDRYSLLYVFYSTLYCYTKYAMRAPIYCDKSRRGFYIHTTCKRVKTLPPCANLSIRILKFRQVLCFFVTKSELKLLLFYTTFSLFEESFASKSLFDFIPYAPSSPWRQILLLSTTTFAMFS